MSLRMRAYYYAVLGAIGALLGWRITDTIGFFRGVNVYLTDLLLGSIIGLCLGLLIGACEGLLTQSWIRAFAPAHLRAPSAWPPARSACRSANSSSKSAAAN
jgi:hypothetical protein